MKKKRYRLNYINILIIILIIIIIICLFNITSWLIDNYNISKQLKFIEENTTIEVVTDDEDTEYLGDDVSDFDPYWDYIEMDLISVDFDSLNEINDHTAGWIQVGGTHINYPFVQAYTNEHYLYNDFYNQSNNAGWVFVDYRNSMKDLNDNTIIYGHSRVDETMFGSLENVLGNEWYDNVDNHIIKLSTEYENTLWQIFSIYTIPETTDYLVYDFDTDETYLEYINLVSSRSLLDFNTIANVNDKLLTLSTCYETDDRLVVHAKLIKRDLR